MAIVDHEGFKFHDIMSNDGSGGLEGGVIKFICFVFNDEQFLTGMSNISKFDKHKYKLR